MSEVILPRMKAIPIRMTSVRRKYIVLNEMIALLFLYSRTLTYVWSSILMLLQTKRLLNVNDDKSPIARIR